MKQETKKNVGRPRLDDNCRAIRVTFSIPEGLNDRFTEFCESKGMNKSEFVRKAIERKIGAK